MDNNSLSYTKLDMQIWSTSMEIDIFNVEGIMSIQ